MTDQADQRPAAELLGPAVAAYRRDEFAGMRDTLRWFYSWREYNWRWTSVPPLTGAFLIVGLWLVLGDLGGVPGLVGAVLIIVAFPATFGLVLGPPIAWFLLAAFEAQIKGSLLRRLRKRLAELREPHVQQALGSGRRFADTDKGTLLAIVMALGGGVWLVGLLALVFSPPGAALMIGGLLLVTASVMRRASRELYERHLPHALEAFSREARTRELVTRYPGSLWVDAIGVTGVVLATPAFVVFIRLAVGELSNSG